MFSKSMFKTPYVFLRPLLSVTMDVIMNGNPIKALKDYKGAKKAEGVKLIPILFSHGYGSHRNAYTGLCKDLASHGCIVFSMDTTDGTCTFTKGKNGVDIMFNHKLNIKA
jgi:hypothetical protein